MRLVRRDDAGDEGLEEEEEGISGEEEDLEGGPDEAPARGHHGGDSATTGVCVIPLSCLVADTRFRLQDWSDGVREMLKLQAHASNRKDRIMTIAHDQVRALFEIPCTVH